MTAPNFPLRTGSDSPTRSSSPLPIEQYPDLDLSTLDNDDAPTPLALQYRPATPLLMMNGRALTPVPADERLERISQARRAANQPRPAATAANARSVQDLSSLSLMPGRQPMRSLKVSLSAGASTVLARKSDTPNPFGKKAASEPTRNPDAMSDDELKEFLDKMNGVTRTEIADTNRFSKDPAAPAGMSIMEQMEAEIRGETATNEPKSSCCKPTVIDPLAEAMSEEDFEKWLAKMTDTAPNLTNEPVPADSGRTLADCIKIKLAPAKNNGEKLISVWRTYTVTSRDLWSILNCAKGYIKRLSKQQRKEFSELAKTTTKLELQNIKMNKEKLAAIFKLFPLITELNVSGCSLDKASLELIASRKELKSLKIGSNYQVTDATISLFKNLPNLQQLDISCCWNITGKGFAAFEVNPSLKSLDVSLCSLFTDEGLTTVTERFPRITKLNLGYCKKISSEGFKAVYTFGEARRARPQ